MVTTCKNCEQDFDGEAYYIKLGRKKYCGTACRNESLSKQMAGIQPLHLQTEDVRQKHRLAKLGRRGSDTNNWRGGVHTLNTLERERFHKSVRHNVLVRDGFACQVCQKVGGKLHVDHIQSWAANPELRFDESNCRTLCVPCHYYVTFKKKMPDGLSWGYPEAKEF